MRASAVRRVLSVLRVVCSMDAMLAVARGSSYSFVSHQNGRRLLRLGSDLSSVVAAGGRFLRYVVQRLCELCDVVLCAVLSPCIF